MRRHFIPACLGLLCTWSHSSYDQVSRWCWSFFLSAHPGVNPFRLCSVLKTGGSFLTFLGLYPAYLGVYDLNVVGFSLVYSHAGFLEDFRTDGDVPSRYPTRVR